MTSTADLIERALADLPATIRARRGPLSYRQAANEAGVHFTTFRRVENGTRQPDAVTLIALVRWAESPIGRGSAATMVGAGRAVGAAARRGHPRQTGGSNE